MWRIYFIFVFVYWRCDALQILNAVLNKILYIYILQNIFGNGIFNFFPCWIIGKLAFENTGVLPNVGLNGQGHKVHKAQSLKILSEISHCLLCLTNSYSNYIVISQYNHLELGVSWRLQIIVKYSFERAEKID